jgi:hypothetical protein
MQVEIVVYMFESLTNGEELHTTDIDQPRGIVPDVRYASCDFSGQEIQNRILHIVANKKSHFRPSDEVSMRTVDKDAVNTKIGPICFLEALSSISGVGACAVRMRFRALLRVWLTWRGSPPRAARLAGSCRTASPVVVLKGRRTRPC